MRILIPLLTCLVSVCGAPAAAAQQRIVPPNDAAISEFLTVTPGPGGDEVLARAKDARPSLLLSTRKRRLLERLGPQGKETLDLLNATSPSTPRGGERDAVDTASVNPRSQAPARKMIEVVAKGQGHDGLGLGLPSILLAALVLLIITRLRRRSAPS
jgi:hypothetical protein